MFFRTYLIAYDMDKGRHKLIIGPRCPLKPTVIVMKRYTNKPDLTRKKKLNWIVRPIFCVSVKWQKICSKHQIWWREIWQNLKEWIGKQKRSLGRLVDLSQVQFIFIVLHHSNPPMVRRHAGVLSGVVWAAQGWPGHAFKVGSLCVSYCPVTESTVAEQFEKVNK